MKGTYSRNDFTASLHDQTFLQDRNLDFKIHFFKVKVNY